MRPQNLNPSLSETLLKYICPCIITRSIFGNFKDLLSPIFMWHVDCNTLIPVIRLTTPTIFETFLSKIICGVKHSSCYSLDYGLHKQLLYVAKGICHFFNVSSHISKTILPSFVLIQKMNYNHQDFSRGIWTWIFNEFQVKEAFQLKQEVVTRTSLLIAGAISRVLKADINFIITSGPRFYFFK